MTARQLIAVLLIPTLATLATAAEPRRLPLPAEAVDALEPRVDPAIVPAAYQPLFGVACRPGDDPLTPRYEVGAAFDKGLYIRGVDPQRDPNSMYIGGRLQLRHTGFARNADTWTDSAGVTRPIRNRNFFDAERVRINFQGTAVDPNLSYYFILDGDSDGDSNVDMLAYIMTYKFDDAFQLRFGRWKIASDREWLLSSRFLTLADRSMATDYFRGGFSDGVWVLGDLGEGWHYETSLTNGLSSSNRRPVNLDDNLACAASVYCDPWGDYGNGFQDYACHESPVARLGASCGFDKSDDRSDAGFPLGDDNFVRLSDGTRLSDVGALGPGVQLLGDRVLKASLDAAFKWQGWFVSAEWFLRSIQDLTANGPTVVSQIDDHGFRCDAGVFLVPKRLDVIGRVSQVSGPFGDAYEYAGGFNWYWGSGSHEGKLDDRINKFTFDVTALDGCPVTASTSNLVAGDSGVMFRTQVQIGF